MTRSRLVPALLLATLAGCTGVQLSELRCDTACQDPVDPLVLTLVLTVDGAAGLGPSTELLVRIDQQSMDPVTLDTSSAGDAATIALPVRLPLQSGRLSGYPTLDGDTFTIGVRARVPSGTTNEATLTLQLSR